MKKIIAVLAISSLMLVGCGSEESLPENKKINTIDPNKNNLVDTDQSRGDQETPRIDITEDEDAFAQAEFERLIKDSAAPKAKKPSLKLKEATMDDIEILETE